MVAFPQIYPRMPLIQSNNEALDAYMIYPIVESSISELHLRHLWTKAQDNVYPAERRGKNFPNNGKVKLSTIFQVIVTCLYLV